MTVTSQPFEPVLPTTVTSPLHQRRRAGAGEVELRTKNRSLIIGLGETRPTITGGLAGFDQVDRPDDVGTIEWNGTEPLRMDVPVLLDGFRTRRDQQPRLEALIKLCLKKDGDEPPESFSAHGRALPIRGRRWVMEDIEMGDALGDRDGRLIRQYATLKLLQANFADKVRFHRRRKPHAQGDRRFYTTKKDDTVKKIVAKFYDDDRQKWVRQMLDLNHMRDPRKKLKAGLTLRLP